MHPCFVYTRLREAVTHAGNISCIYTLHVCRKYQLYIYSARMQVPIGTAKTPTREDAGTVVCTPFVLPSTPSRPTACDMSTDNGGWTVFQRRKDWSVDFYRNWDQYVNGFGNLNGEFWLGLRQINEITAHSSSTLRVDLPSGYYAKYSYFSVGDSASMYTLSVSGYSGNAGYDGLSYHNGMKFTTLDQDNDNWGSSKLCIPEQQGRLLVQCLPLC